MMNKPIRDTTIAEAIFEVLEQAKEPLSGQEIFSRLPMDRMVKTLSYRQFWQHFGMFKKRKRYPVERLPCPHKTKGRCWCYSIKKGD